MPLASIMALALGVPLAALMWHLAKLGLGLGSDFVIRSPAPGRVVVRGRIPRSKLGDIKEFCANDVGSDGAFVVRGSWGPGRTLDLRCSGRLSPGQRQRVRNFLLQCLR